MQRTGDRLTKRSGKKRIFSLTKNVDVAHVLHPLGEVGLVMRRPWRSARFERERSTDLRLALFTAPFGLLSFPCFAFKLAAPPSSFGFATRTGPPASNAGSRRPNRKPGPAA